MLVAWGELLSGQAQPARRRARAEVARTRRTGERLAEVEARIVLGVSFARLNDAGAALRALTQAGELAERLPYPAGLCRVAMAQGLVTGGEPEDLGPGSGSR